MPLKPGSSEEVIGENIAELESAGRPAKQAEAIALSEARRSEAPRSSHGFAHGGRINRFRGSK
jgi:hypothetical protein